MKARAYLADEGRVLVEFEPVRSRAEREAAYLMSRRVAAGRWQGRYARAHYPLSVDTCQEMRRQWGGDLLVHSDLSAWFRTAAVDRREQASRTKATDAALQVLPSLAPAFHDWLKPDQRVGAEWMAHAYRDAGLLADQGGVGKTPLIVAGLMERQVKGNILIVCPKISVRSVWGKHLRQWCPWPVYLARGVRAKREKVLADFLEEEADTAVLVIVAEMLRIRAKREKGRLTDFLGYEYEDLFDIDWDAVVLDESHKLLGSMDVVKGNLAAEGLRRLNYSPAPLRLAATATPWGKGGKTESLFGTLHWLWPDEFTSKWRWLPKFFEVEEERVFIRGGGGATKLVKRVGGLKPGVTEQQLWDSLGPRVLRRTMVEVSPQHGGLENWIEVSCEMTGKQLRQYQQFAEHGEIAVEGGIVSATGTLDTFTRARQLASGVLRKEGDKVKFTGESNKVDYLMELLGEKGVLDGTSPLKVVVASQFNEFLSVVAQRLEQEGCAYYLLTGSTSETQRDRIMEAFQDGEPTRHTDQGRRCRGCRVDYGHPHKGSCRHAAKEPGAQVFLLNGRAGGVSITLDAADEMHQLDEMYPPEANSQLYWRIFRRGRVHKVIYYIYRSEGTIDEKIGHNVEDGVAEQVRVLDGRRGLPYARELIRYRPPEEG